MKTKTILFRMVIMVITLMSALGANAAEAYACYTSSNTTLTFYYDNQRSSRSKTYDLNTGSNEPEWSSSGISYYVTNVVFAPSFAGARPTTTCKWFYWMRNLQTITDISYLNTSEVTNMSSMFYNCKLLTSLDLSSFNTSKVVKMSDMFYECEQLTSVNLSNWNTSMVTDMTRMFDYCRSLTTLDLCSFNTSKVTDMTCMFEYCGKLVKIHVGSGWSTAAVSSSSYMFDGCHRLVGGKGTTYDTKHEDVTYAHIDGGTSNPGYLTAEGTEAYACYTPSNTTLTFYYDSNRSTHSGTSYSMNTGSNQPGWETDGNYVSVTQVVFDPSFAGARPTTTFSWFFYMANLQSITGISNLKTNEVTNMDWMFVGCNRLTSLDLIGFNTSKVTSMNWMFRYCSNLQTIYVSHEWNTDAVTSSADMFDGCTSLVGGQGTKFKSSNPKDKTYAHNDGGISNPGYFDAMIEAYACYTSSNKTLTFYYDKKRSLRSGDSYELNTGSNNPKWKDAAMRNEMTKAVFDPSFAGARPTTTYAWFSKMANLQSITGLNYLNTSEVTNMANMFVECTLPSLDLNSFNTSKVTDMSNMFDGSRLTNLELSSFNTSQVTNMDYMFRDCSNLRTIYVGNGWTTDAVMYSFHMFKNCTSLVGGQGTSYNNSGSSSNKDYAHIDGGTNDPGYFTARFAGIATDIETVPNKATSVKGIYPLDGRKLNELPAKKGVYIQNGRAILNN